MFTMSQIEQIHAKVKTGADFPHYVQELKALGMAYYDFFVVDGHTEYVATSGECLHSPAKYTPLTVAAVGDAQALHHTIAIHQQGLTDFATFCTQAAQAGVHYWRTDVTNLRCVYVDGKQRELWVEAIPEMNAKASRAE